MAEVEGFLTGQRPTNSAQASTRTTMFTDIVASTKQLAALGDRAWTELLQRHDELSTDVLERFGGRCVKTTGDGLLAELPDPIPPSSVPKCLSPSSAASACSSASGYMWGLVNFTVTTSSASPSTSRHGSWPRLNREKYWYLKRYMEGYSRVMMDSPSAACHT
jgi:hypothetical protein